MGPQDSTLLYGGSVAFVEGLYEDFLHDPLSVSAEWRGYFDELRSLGLGGEIPHAPVQKAFLELARHKHGSVVVQASEGEGNRPVTYGISALIGAYRAQGHLAAKTNPLHLRPLEKVEELEPSYYGIAPDQMDVSVTDGGFKGPLGEVLKQLEATYCGAIGFEFAYLPRVEREWLQARVESGYGRRAYLRAVKVRLLEKLTAAEGLERYLGVRYVGQKRFSLEGSESLIPMLDRLILDSGVAGVKEIVIGMAHRGRLNVLVNTFGKKPSDLFKEFEGKKVYDPEVSGDVKYHMGFSSDVQTDGGPVHLALAFNPSHLEIVGPVVVGSVRARQDRRDRAKPGTGKAEVVPVLIHGDAALPGQGVVAETLNLSQLRGFSAGGTVHIVINNQVGFTVSDPRDTRSSRYCTDIAKFIDAPVFHVNGDDPEACAFATQLALEYRMEFGKDSFVDLIAFRKYGHNESDEPLMTQPTMYKLIKAHPGARSLYAAQLEKEGALEGEGGGAALETRYRDALDLGEAVTEAVQTDSNSDYSTNWKKYLTTEWFDKADTGVPLERLGTVGLPLTQIPQGFTLNRAVERIVKVRAEMLEGKQPLDWGMAENLAYATLVSEGFRVRLTGQDSGRGTFSHRHAVWHDQNTPDVPEGETYIPLEHISPEQATFEVIDSTLSEEAVLAFEYGYTSAEPNTLDIWEAQYGDFANGAQAVVDQFISAGESKWQRLSGVTLMLPHGYEGQGPEHSSARLERYLQLCAEDNMQVVVPSTPAQMFHLLRRQVVRPYRKPLIIMSPKSMLRNKLSVSSLTDLSHGEFQNVIPDREIKKAARVVICSGKLYWELWEARDKAGRGDVAIVRLEQLYPFPADELRAALEPYPNADIVWAQEEPANQGAWFMLREDLQDCMGLNDVSTGRRLSVSSRPRSAAPAVGYNVRHVLEQQAVIDGALGLAVGEDGAAKKAVKSTAKTKVAAVD